MKIGIDLGGSHIAIGVIDDKGYIVEKTEALMRKKKSRVIKVNVIYGDKNLKDCMEQVIQKHERSFDFLTLIS